MAETKNNRLTGTLWADPDYDNQIVELIRTNKNDPNDSVVDEGGYAYATDRRRLQPITLDKIWFKRLGFEEGEEGVYWKTTDRGDGSELAFNVGIEGWEVWLRRLDAEIPLEPIKYVHELQMVWIAFAGKDLPIPNNLLPTLN